MPLEAEPNPIDEQALLMVQINFKHKKGFSFTRYCRDQKLGRRNVENAILRVWTGPTAEDLRKKVIADSEKVKAEAERQMQLKQPITE